MSDPGQVGPAAPAIAGASPPRGRAPLACVPSDHFRCHGEEQLVDQLGLEQLAEEVWSHFAQGHSVAGVTNVLRQDATSITALERPRWRGGNEDTLTLLWWIETVDVMSRLSRIA